MRDVEKYLVLFLLVVVFLIPACIQKDPTREGEQNTPVADSVPQAATEGMTKTSSGLRYQDIVPGSGASPSSGKTVVVHYTGRLANGITFDSSLDRNEPFVFVIGAGQVIKGWDEGVMSMKIGGKRKLIIPPELGYGAAGAGDKIPPNATLEFEVILLDIR